MRLSDSEDSNSTAQIHHYNDAGIYGSLSAIQLTTFLVDTFIGHSDSGQGSGGLSNHEPSSRDQRNIEKPRRLEKHPHPKAELLYCHNYLDVLQAKQLAIDPGIQPRVFLTRKLGKEPTSRP